MRISFSSDSAALAQFQAPIIDDLARFRDQYRITLESGLKVVDRIVAYLVRSHGKGLRPMLCLLCSKLGGNDLNEDSIRAAVVVELLHEATLVHDDVVDEAPKRRGFPSLSARFKNKVSVLFGDYMLANVLTETLGSRNLLWLDILADTSRRMAKGELVQAVRTRRLDMTESDYLEMIGNKTAALFGACCRLGALTGGLDGQLVENLGDYGENLGVTFQIRDDLLDLFGNRVLTGKPVGGDLREKKLTLPLLKAFANADPREARRIRARIRRGVKRAEIKLISEFVRAHEGDRYADEVMRNSAGKALEAVNKLPDHPVKQTLVELVEFASTRRR